MKKLMLFLLLSLLFRHAHAFSPVRQVQISTNSINQQAGYYNVAGGSVTNLGNFNQVSSGTFTSNGSSFTLSNSVVTGTKFDRSTTTWQLGEFSGTRNDNSTTTWIGAGNTGTRNDSSTTTFLGGEFSGTRNDNSTVTYVGAGRQGTKTESSTTTLQGAVMNGTSTDNSTNTHTGTNTWSSSSTYTGPILAGTTAGTSGYALLSQGNGLAPIWASAGRILQVVKSTQTSLTQQTSTSASYSSTTLNVNLTPFTATSKIIVIVTQSFGASGTAGSVCTARINRDTTAVQTLGDQTVYINDSTVEADTMVGMIAVDTPGDTAAHTYRTVFARSAGSGTCITNSTTGAVGGNGGAMILVEISSTQ